MRAIFRPRRTLQSLTRRGALIGLLALAACGPVNLGGLSGGGTASIDPEAPVSVALLVPAGSATQGNDILASNLENAARLAVGDLTGVQIDLRVYSTQGDPAIAAQVARQAVDEGARIILGPVHGAEATAVGTAVAGDGINVLAFSNNPAIAGNNVFVLGLTPDNAARRILTYANANDRGQVMVIGERTTGGELMLAAVNRAAAETGAQIVATETYEFSQQGIVNALPQLASTARSSGARSILFTADSAGALPVLAQLLPDNRIAPPQFQFMGVTQWNVPPATLQLRGLQEGWFTLPDPAVTGQFESRYEAAYGAAPHPIAGLAYDGIAAIGALLGTGSPDAFSRASLTQGSGFVGVNGVFRFLPDGTNQRGLAVAAIRDNAVVILDPAPRSFAGTGL
ncbi:penicillin-binding protein activator [Pararhodobacter marinus]|uniref:Penicillin-binding protein activator n=1 Tax=Pararhodobacter marinus TaxID=2184063 RepID=A0A2U2C3X1_9RHOB|nr:penicillin-binding protein activator [Pararhodobacter marinus]PWE26563.1 penicillin-binding protein activator [Pararhodobacter marinus]